MNRNKKNLFKIFSGIIFFSAILLIIIQKSDSQLNFQSSEKTYLDTKSDAPHDVTCNSCHLIHNSADAQLTSVAGNANLCISCHNPAGTASALPLATSDIADPSLSTGNSHAWNKSAVNAIYETNTPSNTEMAARIYSGQIVCSTCHDQHSQSFSPFLRMDNTGDAMCKDCHSARDVGRYIDDNTNHKGSHPVGLLYSGSGSLKATPTGEAILVGSNIECTSCHQMHYAEIEDGNILRQTGLNPFSCNDCHTYGDHNGFTCDDCHQTHNPIKDNIYMIKDVVNGSTVNFYAETGANSFGDEDGTEDGICEVCHTTTDFHLADGSGATHNPGTNCTTCHTHDNSFDADCTTCHRDNNPDWNLNDGHVSHTQKYSFACSTCHDGNNHDDGTIDISFASDGLAYRNGLDSNTPEWEKTGSPANSCDNIYCHSNGKTADRGWDGVGTYTWGDSNPPYGIPYPGDAQFYATTPNWNTGSITACTACHGGLGSLPPDPYDITDTGPYQITGTAEMPNTGGHGPREPKHDGTAVGSWGGGTTQCFFCHDTDSRTVTGGVKKQGTYGTSFHVDGQTHFTVGLYPTGTGNVEVTRMAGHCGGKTCWGDL